MLHFCEISSQFCSFIFMSKTCDIIGPRPHVFLLSGWNKKGSKLKRWLYFLIVIRKAIFSCHLNSNFMANCASEFCCDFMALTANFLAKTGQTYEIRWFACALHLLPQNCNYIAMSSQWKSPIVNNSYTGDVKAYFQFDLENSRYLKFLQQSYTSLIMPDQPPPYNNSRCGFL